MNLQVTSAVCNPRTGEKLLRLNEQFGVFVSPQLDEKKEFSLVIIGDETELDLVEQKLLKDGVDFEPLEIEINTAMKKILYAYNAYVDNIGIVI